MKLWNKKPLKSYGVRISESVLVILCSIIKGEAIIHERLAKEKETTSTSTTTTTTTTTTSNTNTISTTVTTTTATSATTATASSVPSTTPAPPETTSQTSADPEVNQIHLQALMDMGFARERCMEAVAQTHTLQQATEYLLMNPLMDQVAGVSMNKIFAALQ